MYQPMTQYPPPGGMPMTQYPPPAGGVYPPPPGMQYMNQYPPPPGAGMAGMMQGLPPQYMMQPGLMHQ